MQGHRIRPSFSIPLTPGPDDAMEVLRERLRGGNYEECTRSRGRCAYFFVDEEERKMWSPHLSVQVEPSSTGSVLKGRFGPHPEMWTLFLFLYTAVGFLAIIGLMLGFIQWQSGMSPWGFGGVLIGVPRPGGPLRDLRHRSKAQRPSDGGTEAANRRAGGGVGSVGTFSGDRSRTGSWPQSPNT